MNRTVPVMLILAALAGTGCSEFNDERGVGDAPVQQMPDEERAVWPNGNGFPNISAFCIGHNGVYTTTRNAPPEVVPDDPECGENGALTHLP